MTSQPLTRVTAVQFGVVDDVAANLQTCLRMIDQAAAHHPQVMVLPEFVNHLAWYENAEHCYAVAVPLEGEFIDAIAAKAAAHRCYIKINVTLRRENGRVTGTNILLGSQGQLLGITDKQILMGNENNFLQPATEIAPILATDMGDVGMYCCMDGVIPEVARALAVRRPQLLLNSLNSFAFDEASLHIPVRAAENKVFIVAANKVGALVPLYRLESAAARLKIAPHFLHGAGESQVVGPDGRVLAKGPRTGEAVVVADIDLSEADDKRRPDGTDILTSRRPSLYAPIGQAPVGSRQKAGVVEIRAGVFQPAENGEHAIGEVAEALSAAVAQSAQFIVLPELFYLPTHFAADLAAAEVLSQRMIADLQAALARHGSDAYVATSVVERGAEGWGHAGALFHRSGVVLRQSQLHACGRHPWVNTLGDSLATVDLPWGRVALVVGGDAIYPETFRLAALQNVEVVGAPTQVLESWENALGFPERAAENRMNVVVGSRVSAAGGSGIYAITEDFTLWTEWKNRPFDGNINFPEITPAPPTPGWTWATLRPAAAANRMVSHRTNVVDGRPWHLAAPITSFVPR